MPMNSRWKIEHMRRIEADDVWASTVEIKLSVVVPRDEHTISPEIKEKIKYKLYEIESLILRQP